MPPTEWRHELHVRVVLHSPGDADRLVGFYEGSDTYPRGIPRPLDEQEFDVPWPERLREGEDVCFTDLITTVRTSVEHWPAERLHYYRTRLIITKYRSDFEEAVRFIQEAGGKVIVHPQEETT